MKLTYLSTVTLLLVVFISCNNDDDTGVPDPVDQDGMTPTVEPGTTDLFGRIPCQNGFSDIYPCDNYDIMSHISIETLGVTGLNDIWGWTDPMTSREYAIIGTIQNTTFIDITDAENPLTVGVLPSQTVASRWRDAKVYQDHAFIVSEAANHGMQVFDLTRLRAPQNTVITFDSDAVYSEFGNTHNIVINEDTGFAYAVGTQTFVGGPHFVDISNPLNPTAAGGFADLGYTHDAQAVTYIGPDDDYTGRELFIGSNEDEVVIVDVTDKATPVMIATVSQDNVGYTHQGWFDEEQRYFYVNDELDETQFGFNSRTLVFDLEDLDNPLYIGPYFGPNQAIDHNLYVNGTELFLSNYTAGLRVADISGGGLNGITDIGFFDSFPENDATEFNGVWSVYPYFESGNIIISDVTNGFFVIRKTGS